MERSTRIEPLDARRLDTVRDLWQQLVRHHAAVAPELPPVRDLERSWTMRRARYAEWLAEPPSFGLVAFGSDQPLGYAVVRIGPGDDTWEMGESMASIETLAVAPGARGRGLGGRLMGAIETRLGDLGVADVTVCVVATNLDAARFYRRHGFRSFQLQLYRDRRP